MPERIRCNSCGEQVRTTATECPNCGNRIELVDRSKTTLVIGILLLPLTFGGAVGAVNHGTLDAQLVIFLGLTLIGPVLIAASCQKRKKSANSLDAR